MRKYIKSILLFVLPIIIAITVGLSVQTEPVKANDDICDTWDDYYGYCHGAATNCFCAIIIEG